MPYTIFISHTQNDKRIAEAIKRKLTEAYKGQIRFFLAVHDLGGGNAWKDEIKKRLLDCNAIMTILTEQSVQKPWIFIEWSAFWVNEKMFYTLTTEEVRLASLVDPMKDRQNTVVTDLDQVKSLFRSLTDDSKYPDGIPYDYADDFVVAMRQAIALRNQELASFSYGRFRDSLLDLPRDDTEKRRIAQWFYGEGEIDIAKRITTEIRDDLIKAEMAAELVRLGDLNNAHWVVENIRAADRLGSVARALIDYGYLDTRLIRDVVDDMLNKNQAEVRSLCLRLIDVGQHDTALFNYIVQRFTSMPELRKVATGLIQNDLTGTQAYEDVLDRFAERNGMSELRNVAEVMIEYNLDRNSPDLFRQVITVIADRNQREAEKALIRLTETNSELVRTYLVENVITAGISRERLEKLLSLKS